MVLLEQKTVCQKASKTWPAHVQTLIREWEKQGGLTRMAGSLLSVWQSSNELKGLSKKRNKKLCKMTIWNNNNQEEKVKPLTTVTMTFVTNRGAVWTYSDYSHVLISRKTHIVGKIEQLSFFQSCLDRYALSNDAYI